MIPKPLIAISVIVVTAALVPPAIIARARTAKSPRPRIHIIQDMDAQAKLKPQQTNDLFADGRAMRLPVEGTVSRVAAINDDHLTYGVVRGAWATSMPENVGLDRALLERGQARFEIYCALCHGYAGYGDGVVHARAMELQANPAISNGTTWVQPKNIHDPEVRDQPVGQIYNTITNGIRNMSGYAAQIPTEDRWAIAAYVKALQRSQNAKPGDVSARQRENLPLINLVPADEEEANP